MASIHVGAFPSVSIRGKFESGQFFLSARRALRSADKLGERQMVEFTHNESLQPTAQNAGAFLVPSAAFGCSGGG